jgi:hypothetical protein
MNYRKILMISSYPPRECGIGTFSQGLISTLQEGFRSTLKIKVCVLQKICGRRMDYPWKVTYTINAHELDSNTDNINFKLDDNKVIVSNIDRIHGGAVLWK